MRQKGERGMGMIKRMSWRQKWEMRSDIDSTRPKASLTVSVGRALRDQPVQSGKGVSSHELMLNDEQQLPTVCSEKRVLLLISNVCHGHCIRNGGKCARIYFPDGVSTSSLWSS